jgi:adenylate cyclase
LGYEIERKFLLRSDAWRAQVEGSERMTQGYLQRSSDTAIRVRVSGEQAHLNIKKSLDDGVHRLEFEYPIPLADAQQLLQHVALPTVIDKTRHRISLGAHTWEIDEFHGANAGLIVAEIELRHADEAFQRPDWLGEEVSTDRRYYNSALSEHPYSSW